MCGRFSLAVETIVIAERFKVPTGTFEWKPRYNMAPTQLCPTIAMLNNQPTLCLMRWGLIPHWSKEGKSPFQMINARAETLRSKPSYRESFFNRRCLVPADGFFEWKKGVSGKVPFRAALKNDQMFAFAGLWDIWQDGQGKQIPSFTIVTTESNSLVAPLHDRMPVILRREDESLWLDSEQHDPAKLETILKPYPTDEMKLYKVSPVVNTWKNDSPECIEPQT